MHNQLIQQITTLQLITYGLVVVSAFLIILLLYTRRQFRKYEEHYNGFVLFCQEETEELQTKYDKVYSAFISVQKSIASQTLADIEDWNELNAKVDLLMQKEANQEQRAIAVNKILEQIRIITKPRNKKRVRK